MKYITGIVVGLVLGIGGVAFARSHGMVIVNEIEVGYLGHIQKVYDNDNGVVCYAYKDGNAGGISCLRN